MSKSLLYGRAFAALAVFLLLISSSCGVTPAGGPDETAAPAASNRAGSEAAPSQEASTPSVQPTAFTEEAIVRPESAVLLGLVNPKSGEADVWFEWGYDPALEEVRRSPVRRVRPGNTTRPLSYETDRLQRGATYYYRIVASGPSGKAEGDVKSFTFWEGPAEGRK